MLPSMQAAFPDLAEEYESFLSWVRRGGTILVASDSYQKPEGKQREMEIQAQWFGGEFGKRFTGTEGEQIEIIQFGHWNRGAGPDFTEVALRIDGVLKRGALEIDLDARSWESHGHGVNRAFNDVVLHVFTDQPALNRFYTRSEDHRNVPQLLLPQFRGLEGPPDFLPEAKPGRCVAPLASMVDEDVESLLAAAAQYRLRKKSQRLSAMMRSTSTDQAMFQALAEALGFRQNKTQMAILAQRCQLSVLREMNPQEREACLFGAAGFLNNDLFEIIEEESGRSYLRGLWDRWWAMRGDFELSPNRAIPWQYAGNRPLNHPQRRIGALSALVNNWAQLRVTWEQNVNNFEKRVNKSLNNVRHPYWEKHYTLSSAMAPKFMKLVGQDRQRDMLGNVFFPGVMGAAEEFRDQAWMEYLSLRKVDTNQKLRRAALRLFGQNFDRQKLFTSYYHQQQGLLQVYHDFCLEDSSNCENCPFPEQLTQWETAAVC